MSMERAEHIWMDGSLVPWDEARVHVLTHALHYGTAYFEGIRCYALSAGGSAVFRLPEHVRRLGDSGRILGSELPYTEEQVTDAILETIRANGLRECYIRPLAYVAEGEMGLYAPSNPVRFMVAAWRWGTYLGDEGVRMGIRMKVSSYVRHHVNAAMTKSKIAGNYVNSVLAKTEVKRSGYDEAVMLDTEGYVSEASGENIFLARGGRVKTTPLTSILSGITRDSVITLLRDRGVPVVEERFTRDELYAADEAFLTGTAAEVTPIREVDDRSIGRGRPGPITQALQESFFQIVRGEEPRYARWLTRV